mmetsp:Transcript_57487/g.171505  ORF Transcript_57487/g.171505 Transcript_57487/m.171505 type:complete len:272 (-) Transcript_57487:361-1176(-)
MPPMLWPSLLLLVPPLGPTHGPPLILLLDLGLAFFGLLGLDGLFVRSTFLPHLFLECIPLLGRQGFGFASLLHMVVVVSIFVIVVREGGGGWRGVGIIDAADAVVVVHGRTVVTSPSRLRCRRRRRHHIPNGIRISLLGLPPFHLPDVVLGDLIQTPGQKLTHEYRLIYVLPMSTFPPLVLGIGVTDLRGAFHLVHELIEGVRFRFVGIADGVRRDEMKELTGGHDVQLPVPPKIIVHVPAIPPQKIEGRRMIRLDRLGHVDDVHPSVVPQ